MAQEVLDHVGMHGTRAWYAGFPDDRVLVNVIPDLTSWSVDTLAVISRFDQSMERLKEKGGFLYEVQVRKGLGQELLDRPVILRRGRLDQSRGP